MNRSLLIAVCLLLIWGCNPNNPTPTPTPTPGGGNNNTPSCNNSNLITYGTDTVCGSEHGYWSAAYTPIADVVITKFTSGSNVIIGTANGSFNNPATVSIEVDINNNSGPANGIGTYLDYADAGSVIESFSGGQTYDIDTAEVTVTEASNTSCKGTYRLVMSNSGGSKTITGTFNITE